MSDQIKDNRGPAIIAIGGIVAGFKFYGPFESIDAALTEYSKTLHGKLQVPATIAILEPLTASPAQTVPDCGRAC